MYVRTDDEIYRVNAVWLGPPKATFPWHARYVAYGVGTATFLLVLTAERQLGVGFGFFSTAWALLLTVAITRFLCARITHERPLGAVAAMWLHELSTPRPQYRTPGAGADPSLIRVRQQRPRPKPRRSKSSSSASSSSPTQHTSTTST